MATNNQIQTGTTPLGVTQGGSGVTTSTGTTNLVLSNSPTLTTPIIMGVTDGSTAGAGVVGQIISATYSDTAVTLSSGVAADVGSISLSAGDWEVNAWVVFNQDSTTAVTECLCAINATSATVPSTTTPDIRYPTTRIDSTFSTGTFRQVLPLANAPINVNSTTTIYLIARSIFTISFMKVGGVIYARRVR